MEVISGGSSSPTAATELGNVGSRDFRVLVVVGVSAALRYSSAYVLGFLDEPLRCEAAEREEARASSLWTWSLVTREDMLASSCSELLEIVTELNEIAWKCVPQRLLTLLASASSLASIDVTD
jgi:hypothetical protein